MVFLWNSKCSAYLRYFPRLTVNHVLCSMSITLCWQTPASTKHENVCGWSSPLASPSHGFILCLQQSQTSRMSGYIFFLSRLKRAGKDVFLCEITMQQNIVFLQVGNYVYLEANFRTVNSYSSIHHYSAVLKFLELSTACTEFKCWLFCFE